MNKAANIVAESLTGDRFVTIVLKGEGHTVYPPVIKVLLRAIQSLAKIEVPDKANWIDALFSIPGNVERIIKALAIIIAGNVDDWENKSKEIVSSLNESTLEELKEVFGKVVSLIHVDDFFDCAALAKSVARMAAEPR